MGRIDERDIMFSRMSYEKGTPQYKDYYSKNKDKKEIDDELREKIVNNSGKTAYYNQVYSPLIDSNFRFLADIRHLAEGEVSENKVELDKDSFSTTLKELAIEFGALSCGIVKMKDYHFYTNRGRHPENYGDEIDCEKHKYGIVFTIEMDKDNVNRAPKIPTAVESTLGYAKGAMIGMMLSYYIRELGYYARNHMDGNYLVVAPAVAEDAGLGEVGRIGLLVTKEYGPRVRLGVVTTDLELVEDEKVDYGIRQFCRICGKCAVTCPGKSIPKDDWKPYYGIDMWKSNQESCFGIWTSLGTDCCVCMSTCPLSQDMDREDRDKIGKTHEARIEVLQKYTEKYGIRYFIKDNPKWMK